jgi:myo-inositol-1(or 4)-monophosphatase
VVSIGVAYKEQVVAGLIYNPVLDEMYTAIKGHGAFCNDKPIRVAVGELNEAVINCGCTYFLAFSSRWCFFEVASMLLHYVYYCYGYPA